MPTFDKLSPTTIKEAFQYDLNVIRRKAVDFLSDWIIVEGYIEKFPVQVKFTDESWQVTARGSDSAQTYKSKTEALDEAKRLAIDLHAPLEIYGKSGLLEKRQNTILDIEQPPLQQ